MKPTGRLCFTILLVALLSCSQFLCAQSPQDVFGGQSVTITETSGNSASNIPETAGLGSTGSTTGIVNVSPALNVRTGPWGAIIGSLYNGNKVEIMGASGDWYKIKWGNGVAWVHSDYVNKAAAPAPAAAAEKTGTVTAQPALNIRNAPWGTVIGSFNPGTSVTIVGQTGDWYKVRLNGQVVYCHSDYISTSAAAAPKTTIGTVQASPSLNIRTSPWGAVVGAFYPGNKVTIVGRAGDWYKISWNGQIVYCHASYISTGSSPAPAPPSNTPAPQTGANGKVVLSVPKQCQGAVKCPVPWSACGPTSLGMALAYHNKQNPGALASSLWYTCGTSGSVGTSHAGMVKGAKQHGFPNAKWRYSVGLSWIKEQIRAGKPVIANVYHHYVVITGVDDNGNIYYNDPAKWEVAQVKSYDSFSAWWNGGGCYHAAMTLN